jgi:mannose-6-phosphate isomerase-like protein (cupin superfamily)
MKGFVDDLEELAEGNTDFRRVLYTGQHLQLALISLRPGEEIGEELDADHDEFFRVEKGKGEVWIDGKRTKIKKGDAILAPAGARYSVRNSGDKMLKFFVLHGPPEHRNGIVRATKAEADSETGDECFDGETTE